MGPDLTLSQVLHPDDFDGHKLLKERAPGIKWTTGEHEYSRYGWVAASSALLTA